MDEVLRNAHTSSEYLSLVGMEKRLEEQRAQIEEMRLGHAAEISQLKQSQ